MQKSITVLIFFTLIGLVITNLTYSALPDTVYVNISAVNLRAGPGSEFDKIRTVTLNTPLKVLMLEKGWYKIRIEDGFEGWIAGNLVNAQFLGGVDRDIALYPESDLETKIQIINRLSQEHQGPAFNYLCQIISEHEKHDSGLEVDRIVMPQIFRNWSTNKVTEAIPALTFVMEHNLAGEIGKSSEDMRRLKTSAKEAIKILLRE
jgi:hypothetical protein